MPRHFTRTGFLAAAAAAAAAPASLAAGPADADLANARLLVAIELLLVDFYGRAAKTGHLGVAARDVAARALFNEREHLAAVSRVLTGAGQVPATADDIDFSYPARTFGSLGKTVTVGRALERLAAGAYLGAVAASIDRTLASSFARIAANEAQHLSALELEGTGHAFAQSFPDALTIEQASDTLSEYTG